MVVARFMIELTGRPKEVVSQGLGKLSATFEERYKVRHKELSEPELIKGTTLYSAFIEIEFETKNFSEFFSAMLDFGPTVVEILSPKEINIKRDELQDVSTDLMNKIHELSKFIQDLSIENMTLKQQKQLSPKSNKKR